MKTSIKAWIGALALLASAAATAANVGIFGSYLAIDRDGPGANGFAWYGATQPGPNTTTALEGLDLGVFDLGDSAYISGAEVLSYKNNGGNVTGAQLFWRVNASPFAMNQINFTSDRQFNDALNNVFNGDGDQKWANLQGTPIDFLAGLGAGDHTLQTYFRITSNIGDRFDSRNAANYNVRFSIAAPPPPTGQVPEPSALALAGLSLVLLAGASRRRRR